MYKTRIPSEHLIPVFNSPHWLSRVRQTTAAAAMMMRELHQTRQRPYQWWWGEGGSVCNRRWTSFGPWRVWCNRKACVAWILAEMWTSTLPCILNDETCSNNDWAKENECESKVYTCWSHWLSGRVYRRVVVLHLRIARKRNGSDSIDGGDKGITNVGCLSK